MRAIAAVVALTLTVSASAAIPTSEREALVALYQSTNGNAWTDKTNWLGAAGTECTWYGVACDGDQAHVEHLALYANNLDGPVPSDLRKLTAVKSLQLSDNNLRGSLPSQLSELSQIELIFFHRNQLTGTFPSSWGALKKLREIALDGNQLTGALPVQLGDMSALEKLGLTSNGFTGPIPKELGNLTNLEELQLGDNALTGSIPKELGSLRNLKILNLVVNNLTGSIPAELGNLPALVELDLRINSLTGGIPPALGKLKTLESLKLDNNPLGGPIPKELGGLEAIHFLSSANAQLSGAIPAEIWTLDTLEELQLNDNSLSGTIPADIANLRNLQVLTIHHNELSGTIQIAIANIAPLRVLELGDNAFTGTIPPDLAKLTNLAALDLSGMTLTGAIPHQFGSLTNLEVLTLFSNQLSGAIPAELGQLTKMRILLMGGNELTGTIPDALRNLTKLEQFSAGNRLTGTIPPWIGEWTMLSQLTLGTNRLRGTVPPGLATLENLGVLDIADNELSGALPDLSRMPNLTHLFLQENAFTGSIPPSYGSLSNVLYFWVHGNALTGAIPKELGGLTAALEVNLSDNNLDGSIPPELGNLPNVYSLSVCGNRLGGTIPKELGNLPSVQYLYLCFNALRGPIPKELTKLTKLADHASNFGWNALFTSDKAVKDFVNAKDGSGDFEETQTVTPTNAKVAQMTDRSATLTWTPIRFGGDEGGYQVIVRKSPGGEPVAIATTSSKNVDTITVRRLDPSTQYFFTVSTVSHPFDAQKNLIISDPTQMIAASSGQRVIAQPEVVIVEQPTGLVRIDGVEVLADRFVVANFGDIGTQLTLHKDGDFFTITPSSFSLGPGATQVVTLHSVPQAQSDEGSVNIDGPGTGDNSYVVVTLLSTARPSGTVVAEPLAATVEVAGVRGADSAGVVQFRNSGTAALTGVLLSDQPWIELPRERITIEPNSVVTIPFKILRSRRPEREGALVANLRLVYVSGGTALYGGIGTLGSTPPPGVSVSIVTVVDTTQPMVTTGSIPAPGFGELPLFISGMRSTPSVRSDLALFNGLGSGNISDLRLYFTKGVQTSIATLQPLAAAASLNLVNLIGSVYNSEGSGTLQVRTADWEGVSADAKVTAIAPEGTRVGAVPVFRGDRSIVPGESLGLAGLAAPGDVLLQETGGATAAVHVEFLDAAGGTISTRDQLLERYELVEWTDGVPNGAVAAVVTSISGSFTAYARLRDASGDTWSVVDWSRFYRYERDGAVRVPFADGRSGGGLGRRRIVRHAAASFSTALTLFNPGTEEARARIDTIETSGRTVSREVTLAPHTSQTLSNAGSSSMTETAQLVITPTRGELVVTARSRATSGGTAIPVLPATAGMRLGQTQTFTALDDAALQRTSFGFAETSGAGVTIRARIFIQGVGNSLVTTVTERDYTLAANAQLVVPELVRAFAGDARESLGDLHNLVLELEVVGGGGSVVPFVIATDEGTGDTSLRL